MFEQNVEQKREQIARDMADLGDRLESGDDSELLLWVIPEMLACTHRPLRHHPSYGGSGAPIPPQAKPLIIDWIEWLRLNDIASVISFMHDRDFGCYRDIDFGARGLPGALKERGLDVCLLPWEDPFHSRTDPTMKRAKLEEMRLKALEAFDSLAKPVVLVCSAGIDRSAPAAAFIFESLRDRGTI